MNPFKLLWSFYGRIGRLTYLGGLLLNLALATAVIATLAHFADGRPPHQPGEPPDPVIALAMLPGIVLFIWACFAVTAKRFHDLGDSGWVSLVLIIPLFNYLVIFYLMLARGQDHDNGYGPARRRVAPLPQPSTT